MLKRLALLFALTCSVGMFAQDKPADKTAGQSIGQTVDKVVDATKKVGEVAKDVTSNATQAVAKAAEGPNPNLDRALQFLDTIGTKLGAAGTYLMTAYAKYLMADALAWIAGSVVIALGLFLTAFMISKKRKVYLEETGPGPEQRYRDTGTLGTLSFFSVAPVLVGILIVGWAVISNLATVLAPEGAVIQKVLDHVAEHQNVNR